MADDLVQRLRAIATATDGVFARFLEVLGKDDMRKLGLDPDANGSPIRDAADALARKDAEIAELRKEVAGWRRQAVQRSEDWREQYARAERAEARVREAQTVTIAQMPSSAFGVFVLEPEWVGKRVALVLLDAEEAK